MQKGSPQSLTVDGVFVTLKGYRILQGVYLRVLPGAVTVLFGANGSGKSTLMKVAAGQIQPDSGIVSIGPRRFHSRRQRGRFRSLAYLPQDSMLPYDIRVRRLLGAVRADWLSDDEDLSRIIDQTIADLSGGERRYLELCFVLSLDRSFVLLDEPFAGIEPLLIDRMIERIREAAKRGAGILLTDHYKQYAVPIADRAYLMDNKQCRELDVDAGITSQLARRGYLSVNR